MNEKIIIFKNDKIGDLIHAYNAIKNIIDNNLNKEVFIFLSQYNSEMKFLFKSKNVNFKVITEKINVKDKIKLFFEITLKLTKLICCCCFHYQERPCSSVANPLQDP